MMNKNEVDCVWAALEIEFSQIDREDITNMTLVEVDYKGNCLYDALAKGLDQNICHQLLRQ